MNHRDYESLVFLNPAQERSVQGCKGETKQKKKKKTHVTVKSHLHVIWEFEFILYTCQIYLQGMRRVGAQFIVHLPKFLSPTQSCHKVSSLPTPGQKGEERDDRNKR